MMPMSLTWITMVPHPQSGVPQDTEPQKKMLYTTHKKILKMLIVSSFILYTIRIMVI